MPLKIDETDLGILEVLEKNAKTRIHAIAAKLGVPSSTVHHRIKKLEKEGIIKKWTILKEYALLGMALKAHILIFVEVGELKKIKKTQNDVVEELRKISSVENVDIVTGDADLLLTMHCRDVNELNRILLEGIQSVEGVAKTKTMIVISEE